MSQEHIQLAEFANNLYQEALIRVEQEEEGGMLAQALTEVMMDYLCDAGETENTIPCSFLKLDKVGRKQIKIDGYAFDEGYETIDLFVSFFTQEGHVYRVPKAEISKAANLARKYINAAVKGHLQDMEEAASIFELTQVLWQNRKSFVRANLFILTDGIYDGDLPEDIKLEGMLIKHQIWDIKRFFRLNLSSSKREPILIDFRDMGGGIPCLEMPSENSDYQTYLSIIPGNILAQLYENYGAKLLESNVRAFLQNLGKVNKGIRDTIRKEPHMFLAFNNGISATAEVVNTTLTSKGLAISSVVDFQVVNGGQTTASIFHTHRKDKADLSDIFVQMKLTVINDPERAEEIVPRISRYANTQNKVQEADLSANHPLHIQIQKLSRVNFAPIQDGSSLQTRWFYERVRGQYREEKNREGTSSRKKAFESQNPNSQKFTKTDMAKYLQTWNQRPHIVVRGAQKNYIEFMKQQKLGVPGKVFFEDLIAKAIIFKSTERIYGTGSKSIGDLSRYLIVPYSLAFLFRFTESLLDLSKVWKEQRISEKLEKAIQEVLIKVNEFMHDHAPGGLITEWAKKEDCWKKLIDESLSLSFSKSDLEEDLTTLAAQKRRENAESLNVEEELKKQEVTRLLKTPYQVWKRIMEWGRISGKLSPYVLDIVSNIARKVYRRNLDITDNEREKGIKVMNLVQEENPTLLKYDGEKVPAEKGLKKALSSPEISPSILKKLKFWAKSSGGLSLSPSDTILLDLVIEDASELSEAQNRRLSALIKISEKLGFRA